LEFRKSQLIQIIWDTFIQLWLNGNQIIYEETKNNIQDRKRGQLSERIIKTNKKEQANKINEKSLMDNYFFQWYSRPIVA
jgi:hypothetical protein